MAKYSRRGSHDDNDNYKLTIIIIDFLNYTDTKTEIETDNNTEDNQQTVKVRVSVLPIPAFHHCEPLSVACTQYQWNAGMGNTDTLHPNSCFCSFSIPTSKNKIFVTSLYCFYAHAHETTPTSVYKLSHTHISVEEGP